MSRFRRRMNILCIGCFVTIMHTSKRYIPDSQWIQWTCNINFIIWLHKYTNDHFTNGFKGFSPPNPNPTWNIAGSPKPSEFGVRTLQNSEGLGFQFAGFWWITNTQIPHVGFAFGGDGSVLTPVLNSSIHRTYLCPANKSIHTGGSLVEGRSLQIRKQRIAYHDVNPTLLIDITTWNVDPEK